MKRTINWTKLSLITVALLLLSAFAALFVFTSKNTKRITVQNQQYLVDNTSHIALEIDKALMDGYDNIVILGGLISSSLESPDFDIATMQELLKNSVFDFIEYADPDGYDHNITGGVSDARDRQYYLDAKAGNTGMELIFNSRATHETLLMYYSPLYYQGEFAGSIVGVYQTANRITELLEREYFGERALNFLATSEGRIIASSEGMEPEAEIYVKDLVQGNSELETTISAALMTGESLTFSLPGNSTGACMMRLPQSGWYVISIFPPSASAEMISEANELGYSLVGFLLFVFIVILLVLVLFYKSQNAKVLAAGKKAEEARIQAEEANRAKSTFLFNMSHDIRTPMNAILGFTELAKKNIRNEEKLLDCLDKTQQSGNLLLSLINGVLEMSRIESGRSELEQTPLLVNHSFDNIRSTLLGLAQKKDIKLDFEYGEIQNNSVLADVNRADRIFINIISNAIKYSKTGGWVRARCEQIGTKDGCGIYRYTFEDNGIGISKDFVPKVFDEFSRENSTTASGVQGTGLGLSVVKAFVNLMNGTIECSSEQGAGTTFTVILPFTIVDGQNSADESGAVCDGNETPLNLSGLKVLLVEDNELNREIAVNILEEEQLDVETAENGLEAVERIKEKGPGFYDVVLMDIQMPVMDGYAATKTIRQLYPDASLPIIAVSANAFEEDRKTALEAGMNGHIAKPLQSSALYKTIEGVLRTAT